MMEGEDKTQQLAESGPEDQDAAVDLSSPTPPPSDTESEVQSSAMMTAVLDRLGRLPMPQPVQRGLLWFTAILVGLTMILPFVSPFTRELNKIIVDAKESAYGAWIVVGLAIVFGLCLLVALLKQVALWWEQRVHNSEAHKAFVKQVAELKQAPIHVEPDDAPAHDSAIVTDLGPLGQVGGAVARRLIAVVSGKGGVGKSVLSLGLLEHLSRYNPSLLIDFDLHNRGLTSLLGPRLKPPGYVIAIVREFLKREDLGSIIKSYTEPRSPDAPVTLAARDAFARLQNNFSGLDAGQQLRRLPLTSFECFPQAKVELKDPLNPRNAFFLPSIPPSDSFLASKKVRDASEDIAFLFFKALLHRANHADSITNLIVDCHGAHDLYTVGLIRAATHLIIVTTPEMGGLDGTRDLIRFALKVINSGDDGVPRSILVVNRCRGDDSNAAELARQWNDFGSHGEDRVIRIEKNEAIERLSRNYRFGGIAAVDNYWPHVEKEIIQKLGLSRGH